MNLQTKFAFACTLTAILVISLAAFGVHAISATDDLVIDLYNEPLMGVSYARAANTTFAEARALTVQGQLASRPTEAVSIALHQMEKDIADDLRIVRERTHDDSVTDALDHAMAEIAEWFRSETNILSPPPEGLTELPMPATVEGQRATANHRLDEVVELVAANAFTYRTYAEVAMRTSNTLVAALAGGIILLLAIFVSLFARLMISPIREATRIAEEIAAGNVTTIDVTTRSDEIGRLITCLATMQAHLLSRQRQTQAVLEEKDKTAEMLRHTSMRFDTALNNMSHGLVMCDADGQVLVINRRCYELYGIDPANIPADATYRSIVGMSVAAGNHPGRTVDDIVADLARTIQSKQRETMIGTTAGGRVIAIVHEPMLDGGWVATHEDVTGRQQAEASIVFMARHDALTKLPNRVLFRDRMEQATALAGRGTEFSVMCLDLDNFKQVNDTMGHPVGDGLLVAVADRLSACVREVDTVARLGGDEFAIIQLGVRQPDDAEVLAARIVAAFLQPFEVGGHQIMTGVSIGVAVAPGDGASYETLMRDADIALYLAKTEGGGRVRFFEPEMDARIHIRRLLELDLQGAINRDEFELYYQPLVSLITNKITGFEALLRWHHPVRGLVSPMDFIPVAEETGMIVAIGEWVLHTACFEAENWPDDITVAVNLSPVQFKKGDLVGTVQAALAASGLRPDRLELEITESVFLRDTLGTLTALRQLRVMGIGVALDDFGTGYSSLSCLHRFPFSKIKIDQSFVRDLMTNNESMSIIRAVTGLGKSLGIKTIAEGVETLEQLDRLRREGCDEAQGYLFSRPTPASEVPAQIEKLQLLGQGANSVKIMPMNALVSDEDVSWKA